MLTGQIVILCFGFILCASFVLCSIRDKSGSSSQPSRVEYKECIRKCLDNPMRPYKLFFKTKSGKKIYNSWYFEPGNDNDDIVIVVEEKEEK
jgi:hypothetical protein